MPPSADLSVLADSDSSVHQLPAKTLTAYSHGRADLHGKTSHLDIIDIRHAEIQDDLKQQIVALFNPDQGPRMLPTLLLYDTKGLQLFEEITYLEEYYLTNHEISILEASAKQIAETVPQGAMVIELGSGNLRKVNLLLRAFEQAGKDIDYYALDLSRRELERTLAQLPPYDHVTCHGLLGTYDDGREWLQSPAVLHRQKCILTLGSSIGNFSRVDAAQFLRGFASILCPGDSILVGVDHCSNPGKVYRAYNDSQGVTHRFILNGLAHANAVLGEPVFRPSEWRVIGEYVHDADGGYHQAFVAPLHETVVMGQTVRPYERIEIERSWKYAADETAWLWKSANLVESCQWTNASKEHGLHLLTKPKLPFSLLPSVYARTVLPSLDDWEANWHAWDTVTRRMLPNEELLQKPIKLRNACIFYLGHIPTFLDIQLNKTTGDAPTEPVSYATIFERGIDPDVDNPELCHAHSEIPDEWPPLSDILVYQIRVRERVRSIYHAAFGSRGGASDGTMYSHAPIPRPVAQAIWVGFEHDLMHVETLLYMMLQSDKTLPPPDAPKPDFFQLAAQAVAARVPNQWFDVPAQEIVIGIDDPDNGTDPTRDFGWDNEKPSRREHVHAFQAQGRPITNEEYAQYMWNNHITKLPASWATTGYVGGYSYRNANGYAGQADKYNGHTNGYTNGHGGYLQTANGQMLPLSFVRGKAMRTVYGLVPLELALDWPLFASYDELSACASWMGGRLPTFAEARSIYAHVDATRKQAGAADSLFVDLDGANVGMQHWHPMPVTAHGDRLAGQAEMGGVWEWTSTTLRPHAGFKAMELYGGYTADFFDEKHNIVLGGSWATHPRIAGRKSFVNWYQRNYPYAWVGARLVRDME